MAQTFVPVRFKAGTYYGHILQKSNIVLSDLNDGKVLETTLLLSYGNYIVIIVHYSYHLIAYLYNEYIVSAVFEYIHYTNKQSNGMNNI